VNDTGTIVSATVYILTFYFLDSIKFLF